MDNPQRVSYLIIGAGPAGLQLGYFMQKAGLEYVIVEAASKPGAFFERYPRHRKLISVNKVYTGFNDAEKNLRWDWNSLLSSGDDITFRDYSDRYFPLAHDYIQYMRDYAQRHTLKVHYNTRITRIVRDGSFMAFSESGTVYAAVHLVIATGVSKPYYPDIDGIDLAESYQDFSIEPDDFKGQSVLVLGKGNSAFETAENLIETTSFIHVASRRPVSLAWKSKFVGHLRAVNNNFLDTYQLKLQNAILDGDIRKIEKRDDGRYVVTIAYAHANGECEQLEYDRVLVCTGFRFDASIFDDNCRPALAIDNRFPHMTSAWESVNVPGMYFAGTITQQRDYRKTASGFIHGFRYNARSLFWLLCSRHEGQAWPRRTMSRSSETVAEAILARVNCTSGLWQQFGFLCDVIDIDNATSIAHYYEEMPVEYALESEFSRSPHWYTLTLEFGDFSGDPFAIERNPDPTKARESKFLHPVLRRFEYGLQVDELHLLEDLHADWSKPCHRDPLKAFLSFQFGGDNVGKGPVALMESVAN